MRYSMEDIKKHIAPIAEKYGLREVYVFGSYARNEATDDSDIDFLIDREGSRIHSLLDISNLYDDIKDVFGVDSDIVTVQTLAQKNTLQRSAGFVNNINRERVKVYG